jgi:hypothetical protein
MRASIFISFTVFFIVQTLVSCYRMRSSNGGGQIGTVTSRMINTADIALAPGYKIEPILSGLTFPTAVSFDNEGNLYVIEAGYSYGEVWGEPKLLRVENGGATRVIATGDRNGPWSGITWYNGSFYIAEGGEMTGGKILKVETNGKISTIIDGLPSMGDHHTNGPVIRDGYIYFGQGTATNSSVVGRDNHEFGWLARRKDFHDIPCRDIVLNGINYESENPLTEDPNDKVSTGSFVPFGITTSPGQVIKGKLPCSGAILRIPVTGGSPELYAWGLRNPFGLAFSPEGKLFVTENGYDERGSRPVWGSGDVLWEIQQGQWYGWPDFSAGKSIVNEEEFKSPKSPAVKAVLQTMPGNPPKPAAILGVHSSSNGLDFSASTVFGFTGEAFIAQFGDMAPKAGKVLYPVGFKIVRVNVSTGVVRDFAVNKGKRHGPASWLGKGGLERPVSVKFSPSGDALYVVDFGIMKITERGPMPQERTGMIWKISKN